MAIAEARRRYEISSATFYAGKSKYGGLTPRIQWNPESGIMLRA
jgi:hypothetical protein